MAASTKVPPKDATSILDSIDTVGELCTPQTGVITIPTAELVGAILRLVEAMSETVLYPYQREFSARVIESILERDAATLTALFSRQSGKTQAVGGVVGGCMVILPALAKQFPKDWRFNLTDDIGRYRGFAKGISFGIYAPIQEQSQIMHERIRTIFDTNTAKGVLDEMGLLLSTRGNKISLSNGSSVLAMTASKNSNIEGHTHHVVVAEEAQDIDTMKIRKSIHPMVSSTKGTIIKIGTASTRKCDFYLAIESNKRLESNRGKRNHFFFPRTVCSMHNSLYRDYVEQEKIRIGEASDEFRMAYDCEWIFERGMFTTAKVLMAANVARVHGPYSALYTARMVPSLVAGIDLGKESDSTVVTLVEVDWNNPVVFETVDTRYGTTQYVAYEKHVVAWLELHGDDYEFQFHEVVGWLSRYKVLRKVVLDATRESSFADRLRNHPAFADVVVEDFVFSTQSKAEGYRLLQGDLLAGRFTFPAADAARATPEYRRFLQQFLDLTKSYANGYLVVQHSDERGAHDDYPDSAMLANWGANTPVDDMNVIESGNFFTR